MEGAGELIWGGAVCKIIKDGVGVGCRFRQLQ